MVFVPMVPEASSVSHGPFEKAIRQARDVSPLTSNLDTLNRSVRIDYSGQTESLWHLLVSLEMPTQDCISR